VNIQPDQRDAVAAFFAAQGGPVPRLYPMVRGRLTAINGRAVTSADYAEDRAKRLVDREFNLSWAEQPQVDNVVVQGRWWTALEAHAAAPPVAGAEPADPPATPRVASTATDGAAPRAAEFSFEVGIAEALGVRLGDRIAYDVAGSALEGPVTSLRTVDWDSFRVNFFVVAPPGALDAYPATWVTSFHLPAAQAALSDALVRRFPNLLVIDVGAVLAQVQTLMAQVVRAVEFVFVFSVIAGLAVLFAAIQSTHDERRHEAAILRTLGASGRQIAATQAAEFAVVGVLAGLLAAGGATGLGWVLAKQVLNVPYAPSLGVWVAGLLAGGVGVLVAGMLGTRGVLRAAPMETLRRG
jgi:putative ABC transport system permease protein